MDHLAEYAGRKAEWTALLALRQGDTIFIYKGSTSGTIVLPRGSDGFGFDPVFLPDGATQTFAESKPDEVNARVKAVEALLKGEIWMEHPAIDHWKGSWQKSNH